MQLGQIVERLRAMSPVDQDFMREWKEMKENGEYTEEDHHHHDDDESEE
ncbi:MAG: hypothetical protein ACW98G_09775 [Candidatus Hodarchaeales archaeon]|jgi:hypothetical protein